MKIVTNGPGPSPVVARTPDRASAFDATPIDMFGAFSVQHFADGSQTLHHTHADAQGWMDYLRQFYAQNFWYADANVQSWAYGETWDNWQDTYGIDAVNAVYHSGHGDTMSDGVYYAPMGAAWEGQKHAFSNQMRLGNEQVNYVFWSTCLSARVKDGHTPRRTWAPTNLGFRMLFGFETVSADDPNYGRYFWEEWAKLKSFSQAWIDASWRISNRQEPVAVACGATYAEADHRLWNERFIEWNHVTPTFWRWRWQNKSTSWLPFRVAELPSELLVADLRPAEPGHELERLAKSPYVDGVLPAETEIARNGVVGLQIGQTRLGTGPNSVRWLEFGELDRSASGELPVERAVEIAQREAAEHGLDGLDLTVDSVSTLCEGGGSERGGGTVDDPVVVGTVVSLRQRINGLPVITPGQGEVRVTVGNDGRPTSMMISTREVDRLGERPRRMVVPPSSASSGARPSRPTPGDPMAELDRQQAALVGSLGDATARVPVREVPETTQVGYEIADDQAFLAARRLVEVGTEDGVRSQHWVVAPLYR